MKRLTSKDIDGKTAKHIKLQQYDKKKTINGVQVITLNIMGTADGYFLELARLNEDTTLKDFPDFKVKQIAFSMVEPGGIKGWHIHYNQEDLWFIPPDSLVLIGLHDLRKDSHTLGLEMKFPLGNHKAQLLYIPRGVAHGVSNISSRQATMVYLLNQQFDLNDPDERRLPVDFFGKDFWDMPKG